MAVDETYGPAVLLPGILLAMANQAWPTPTVPESAV